MYCLPAQYRSQTPTVDDDLARVDDDVVWQPDVLDDAASHADKHACTMLIDVGCGNCRKLVPMLDRFEAVIGVEHPDIVRRLDVPDERLRVLPFDLDNEVANLDVWAGIFAPGQAAWMVASDVIEHLVDPDRLLALMSGLFTIGAVGATISTPDRARIYKTTNLGPPRNRAHAREWTLPELVRYVSQWFTVIDAGHTRRNNRSPKMGTSIVHVRP